MHRRLLKPDRIELYFFGIVFIAFPILSDVEYHVYERGVNRLGWSLFLERLLYGAFDSIPYWIYYRLMLPVLFEKRYWQFGGWLLLFLVLLDGYQHYVIHGVIMHLRFLPDSIVNNARKWYNASVVLHFSVVYVVRQLLVVTALGYYRQSARQQKKLYELEQHQLRAELESLKAQLQPHFFFNTLNNMYSLALQQSTRTAPLIARHADIMRYVLHQARRHVVPLPDEVNFLANYVAVESVRFPEQTTIQFDTQGIRDDLLIEPLLLLPFVENTFKHGLRHEVDAGYVHIALVLIEEELILETRNSRLGNADAAGDTGIGLSTARKRLALLYPEQHELSIQTDETTYSLQLRLILRPYAKVPDRR